MPLNPACSIQQFLARLEPLAFFPPISLGFNVRVVAQGHPEGILSSPAARKGPATPLPKKTLLGETALRDAGMLGKARAAEGAGLVLGWWWNLSFHGGEKPGPPDCVFPCRETSLQLEPWPSCLPKDWDFSPGLACRWAQNDSRSWGPYSCLISRDKTWTHPPFKAGLEGRFCKAELAGRCSYPPDRWGSGVPQAGPQLPPTPTRREAVLVRIEK